MSVFVSVIVPVYNDPAGIEILLNALIAQSYPQVSYEVVVADNGSTDETPQVVQRFQGQHPGLIRLIMEDQLQNSYAARNRGISVARGDIFAFTDADCVPVPGWLDAGVTALEQALVSCGGGNIEFTYQSAKPNIYEYFDSARKLNQQSYIENSGFAATANFFGRKGIFDRFGLFRSDLVSGGDYEFGRRVTSQGERIIYIPDAVVHHPARGTFRAIYKKSKRVALGQKQLDQLELEHGSLSLRQLLPVLSWPVDPQWAPSLSPLDKVKLIVLQNFIRWVNLLVRIR